MEEGICPQCESEDLMEGRNGVICTACGYVEGAESQAEDEEFELA